MAGNQILPFQTHFASRKIPGKSQENPWKKISQKISRKFMRKMLVQKILRKFLRKSQKCPHITALFFSDPIVFVAIFIEWCDFEFSITLKIFTCSCFISQAHA